MLKHSNIDIKRSSLAIFYLQKVDDWLQSCDSTHELHKRITKARTVLLGETHPSVSSRMLADLESLLGTLFGVRVLPSNLTTGSNDDKENSRKNTSSLLQSHDPRKSLLRSQSEHKLKYWLESIKETRNRSKSVDNFKAKLLTIQIGTLNTQIQPSRISSGEVETERNSKKLEEEPSDAAPDYDLIDRQLAEMMGEESVSARTTESIAEITKLWDEEDLLIEVPWKGRPIRGPKHKRLSPSPTRVLRKKKIFKVATPPLEIKEESKEENGYLSN